MIGQLRRSLRQPNLWHYVIIAGVLAGAFVFGQHPSPLVIVAVATLAALAVLMKLPILGVYLVVVTTLIGPIAIPTGTEVSLNPTALLVPLVFLLWLLISLTRHELRLPASRTTRPLVLFLIAGLVSLVIGAITWDPRVPRSDRFIVVQLAQWGIFFFSACAFWLASSFIKTEALLRRLVALFLIVGGSIAILRAIPGSTRILDQVATFTLNRAPFWTVLTALAAGQLLFNRELSLRWRIYLVAVMGAVAFYCFGDEQERASNWVGVVAVLCVLFWLRLPRQRLIIVGVTLLLVLSGVLFDFVYQYAGGDAKWDESGGSRLVLIGRVLEVTMRNPITGIGPAAYRPYGLTRPLIYDRAYYAAPVVNSHNNYVDLFSQAGLLGLGLFLWFMLELLRLNIRLRERFRSGFAGGYAAGMMGAWLAIMVIMAMADWFLPFVYNIGFPGFQASVLVWLFMGGLLTLEQLNPDRQEAALPTAP